MDIGEPTMENEYVKAKKDVLVDCLTCPLCSNLLREATTICVCLHTFCKECIYKKFEDDGTCCCPICNVYLGYSPQQKLRPDNNLQGLRMNIFPTKSLKAPEASDSQTTLTRTKKKSLSSLIIDTNTGLKELSLDKAKAVPEKAGKSRGVISKSQARREVDKADDDPDWTYSPRRSNKHSKASKRKGKRISVAEKNQTFRRTTAPLNHTEASDQKANDSKVPSLRFAALEIENINNTNAKTAQKLTRRARKSTHEPITTEESKEVQKIQHSDTIVKTAILDLNVPASIPGLEQQSTAAASETEPVNVLKSEKRSTATVSENKYPEQSYTRVQPIWFSLHASQDQGEDALPQIPSSYIRMKDGNVPISTIKKYLLKKLNMTDESEVEVMCCGQTLVPSATLNSLVDIWVQFVAKTEGVTALQLNPEGRNSNDHKFVMALTYRKSRAARASWDSDNSYLELMLPAVALPLWCDQSLPLPRPSLNFKFTHFSQDKLARMNFFHASHFAHSLMPKLPGVPIMPSGVSEGGQQTYETNSMLQTGITFDKLNIDGRTKELSQWRNMGWLEMKQILVKNPRNASPDDGTTQGPRFSSPSL